MEYVSSLQVSKFIMNRSFPVSCILISLQFLFPFFLTAQDLPTGSLEKKPEVREEFAEFLIGEDKPEELTSPTYSFHSADFLLARGQGFRGDPPDSKSSFSFEGQTIQSIGKFNNTTVEGLFSGEISEEKALDRFRVAIQNNPIYLPSYYNRGRILSIRGDIPEAILDFEKVLSLFPEYYRAHYHLGLLHKSRKNFRMAEHHFREAVKTSSYNEEAYFELCNLTFVPPSSPSAYRSYPDRGWPSLPGFHQSLCKSLIWMNSGKKYRAYKTFQSLDPKKEEFGYTPRYHFLFGNLSFDLEDYRTAVEQWKQVSENRFSTVYLEIPRQTLDRKIRAAEYLMKNKKE